MPALNGALAAGKRESRPNELSGFHSCQIGTDSNKDNSAIGEGQLPFVDQRTAALALLNGTSRLTRKAGQFLGQCAVDHSPLSDAQHDWLSTLLERAGLSPLARGAVQ